MIFVNNFECRRFDEFTNLKGAEMFSLRAPTEVLVGNIETELNVLWKNRGLSARASGSGKYRKDNREVMRFILDSCLTEEDARAAMSIIETCRSESSTGCYNCHKASLPEWAKSFIHQCCNAVKNLELAIEALKGNEKAVWAAGTAARVKSESRLFENAPVHEQKAAIENAREAGFEENPRLRGKFPRSLDDE